jgi:multimeric flavodoxin WrbA
MVPSEEQPFMCFWCNWYFNEEMNDKMKCCILMGSPRKNGNTAALLQPFIEELRLHQIDYDLVWLYDKQIEPCDACRACQKEWTIFGCRHQDDVQEIFDKINNCDVIVLATPIYSWYCTPPMKALLDRLVYGMNKYYGDEKGPSLWAGKQLAIVVTCGYRPEKGADLFEEGVKRYCKHSQLQFIGMLAERALGYKSAFMTADKREHSRLFAQELIKTTCSSIGR